MYICSTEKKIINILKPLRWEVKPFTSMETRQYFADCSWDSSNLLSSKQAFLNLYKEGFSYNELSSLDFGNLDLVAVLDEKYGEDGWE